MIKVTTSGSFKNTEQFLQRIKRGDHFRSLEKYGPMGVTALRQATPIDEGDTANSWTYQIVRGAGTFEIVWQNSHKEGGNPVAILLQYGHGTGTGGYVRGRDYINPAIRPIFDQMAAAMWKEVTK